MTPDDDGAEQWRLAAIQHEVTMGKELLNRITAPWFRFLLSWFQNNAKKQRRLNDRAARSSTPAV
jgi:hypothetical protein